MKRTLTKITLFATMALTIIAFQNCAPNRFSPANTAMELQKAGLDALPMDHIDEDLVSNDGTVEQALPEELVSCILWDNGKSVKVGIIDNALTEETAVSQSVCMSRHACLEIMPLKFSVQGAKIRGACEGNPNVVILSDDDVTELVKK